MSAPLRQSKAPEPSRKRPRVGPRPVTPPTFAPFDVLERPFGSFEAEVLFRDECEPEESVEWRRDVWADPYVRMLQGPKLVCQATAMEFPKACLIEYRSARHQPEPSQNEPNPRESFFVVPHNVLHPEWAPTLESPTAENPGGPVLVCHEGETTRALSSLRSTLFNMAHFPIDEPPRLRLPLIPDSPAGPNRDVQRRYRTTTDPGATVQASPLLPAQVQHQLELRIQQELEVLVERVLTCAPTLPSVLRLIEEPEREAMRDGRWDEHAFGGDPATTVIAVLELGTEEEEVGRFLRPEKTSTTITCPLLHPSSPNYQPSSSFPTHSSAPPPIQPRSVPYYPLSHLLPATALTHLHSRLSLLLPAPPTPTQTRTTYALLSQPSLLGPEGVDTIPLFIALFRLRMWRADAGGWVVKREKREKEEKS